MARELGPRGIDHAADTQEYNFKAEDAKRGLKEGVKYDKMNTGILVEEGLGAKMENPVRKERPAITPDEIVRRNQEAQQTRVRKEARYAAQAEAGRAQARETINRVGRLKSELHLERLKLINNGRIRRENATPEELSDLAYLEDNSEGVTKGNASVLNIDVLRAADYVFGSGEYASFGKQKEVQKPQAPVKEKPGFFARLFGRKES